jgi:glycosyltransferase involved in cell wall biosynthesis
VLKIAYDYQIFSFAKYGGVSRYIYEISNHIGKLTEFEVSIFAGFYVNHYLKSCNSSIVRGWYVPQISYSSRIIGLVNAEINKRWLNHNIPDIVHETYYSERRIAPKKSKIVLTVHDMIHEKFSHFMSRRERRISHLKAEAIKRADHIICISNSTKQDLLEILDVEPNKVSTIYHGYSLLNAASFDKPKIVFPYILFVGNIRSEYKNFKRLLQAYANNKNIRNNFSLVCFGSKEFSTQEANSVKKLGIDEKNIIFISGDDSILANIYTYASAFVYPSLYEGFGFPVLEAMSLDCPVICSNTSSLPEIVGEAGEYFNPYEIESISEALEKVLFSQGKSQKLKELGKERVKLFSWDTCANETSLVYKKLILDA